MKSIVASALDRNRHILNSRALTSKFTMILKSDLEMQLAYVTLCSVLCSWIDEFFKWIMNWNHLNRDNFDYNAQYAYQIQQIKCQIKSKNVSVFPMSDFVADSLCDRNEIIYLLL